MNPKTNKKRFLELGIIVLIILSAVLTFALSSRADVRCSAANDDWGFSVEAGIYKDGEWISYLGSSPQLESTSFKFVFTGNANPSITEFQYAHGKSYSAVESSNSWKGDGENNAFLRPENMLNIDGAYIWTYPTGDSTHYNEYIKFKAIATVSTGSPQPYLEQKLYQTIFNIVYDVRSIDSSEVKINRVDVKYSKDSANWESYCTENGNQDNIWVTKLQFTIISKNIEEIEAGLASWNFEEMFYYSLDKGQSWSPIGGNKLELAESIKGTIRFKVMAGGQNDIYMENEDGELYIKIDTIVPEFSVDAISTKKENNEIVSYAYSSGWSYNNIEYRINPTGWGASTVSYEYSTENSGVWHSLAKSQNSEYYSLLITNTTRNIRFRARNGAGKEQKSGNYNAYIDKIEPVISINAKDYKNKTIKSFNTAEGQGYRVGYADSGIIFTIYNRDSEGNIIKNESDLTVQYKCVYLNVDGELKDTGFLNMGKNIDAENNTFYSIEDNLNNRPTTKLRTYTFRMQSSSGLYDEKSFEVTILESSFEISIDTISYEKNAHNWASDKIPVYINAPIGEKYIFGYQVRLMNGNEITREFIWDSNELDDNNEENIAKNVSADFSHLREGEPGYIEPGMAKFRIYLITSVEDESFIIYAKNAAEASSNTVTTNKIKLDMVVPKVEISAYIDGGGDEISIGSGDWVSGDINIYLDSRNLPLEDISLSGISCHLMLTELIVSDSQPKEEIIDGVPTGRFTYLVTTDGINPILTRTLMFRLTSGSGKQSFVYFDVRIDKRDIKLLSVKDVSHNKVLFDELSTTATATLDPVCNDVEIIFASNHIYKGVNYFGYYYRIGEESQYNRVNGENILVVDIPTSGAGTVIIEFYLESNASNNSGVRSATREYKIEIPYDCTYREITVNQQSVSGYTTDADGWKNGPLRFLITPPADSEESDFTYGIALLYNQTAEQFYAEKGLSGAENQRALIYNYCTIVELVEGLIDFWGVDEYGVPRFMDPSSDTQKCFYNGNLLILGFNVAKYSTNPIFYSSSVIRVDNSIPDATDLIQNLNGEIDGQYVYNNETIVLKHPNFSDRANIDYYYHLGTPTDIPTSEDLNDWVKLEVDGEELRIGDNQQDYVQVRYYLYAINTLASSNNNHNGEEFYFIIDRGELSFIVDYDKSQGSNNDNNTVFEYEWTREIEVKFIPSSNTGVYYWYSFGNDLWLRWNDTAYIAEEIRFSYGDDINSTVRFKLTNQAGSEIVFNQPAHFKIDTQVPKFELLAYVGENPYIGGSFGSINEETGVISPQFDAVESGKWASSAVQIRIAPITQNASAITYKYWVLTASYPNKGEGISLGSRLDAFSTDRLDTFYKNNDAIIVIEAYCQANGYSYTQAIRVSVDQVKPKFKMNGEVTDDAGRPISLATGEWTNRSEVTLSIERLTENVSSVEISYKISYVGSESSEIHDWPKEDFGYGLLSINDESVIIEATAITASGLKYVQVFQVNIDIVPPVIYAGNIVASVTGTPNTYYIDQKITFNESNVKSAEYITNKGGTVGYPLSQGHIIATNSVDNSESSRGYVKIIIVDLAGNRAELEFYMVPFHLTVNNITLSNKDRETLQRYIDDLEYAKSTGGIDDARVAYFESQIARLKDRQKTLEQEIDGFKSYLAGLSQKASFELKSDYREMQEYLLQYYDYEYYNQQWIQEAITEGDYAIYFQKLEEKFELLDKEMEKVRLVETNTKKLPAINVVQVTDYNNVLQVYDAYVDLLPDQKSVYATNLYNKLITLKRKCENMLLQDEDSGIKIDGNLAPGARIEVKQGTVEEFDKAQETILNTITTDKPRTVVSINKVGMRGAASQTSTGDIMVSLPIPEEYYSYVRFAVYRLSPDGTITEVKDVEIQGDGKSVMFAANSLDTYILATKANIAMREKNEDVYGKIGDIDVDVKMIVYVAIAAAGVFVILIVVVVLTGLRRRRFLSHYNKAHKSSLYKKGIQDVPKGNKPPREHPFRDERVKSPKKPIIKK